MIAKRKRAVRGLGATAQDAQAASVAAANAYSAWLASNGPALNQQYVDYVSRGQTPPADFMAQYNASQQLWSAYQAAAQNAAAVQAAFVPGSSAPATSGNADGAGPTIMSSSPTEGVAPPLSAQIPVSNLPTFYPGGSPGGPIVAAVIDPATGQVVSPSQQSTPVPVADNTWLYVAGALLVLYLFTRK